MRVSLARSAGARGMLIARDADRRWAPSGLRRRLGAVTVQAPADTDARALRAEVIAVRWTAPEGGFAVISALTDDGDEVTITGARRPSARGRELEADGTLAPSRAPRLALRGRAGARARPGERRGAAEPARLGQARRPQRRGIPARAPRRARCSRPSTPIRGPRCAPSRGSGPRGSAPRRAPGSACAVAARCACSWPSTASPAAAAARIERALGPEAIDELRADPYAAAEVDGVGFATADALARALGLPADAPERIDAGIIHALREAASDGHCLLPAEELDAPRRSLLGEPTPASGSASSWRSGAWSPTASCVAEPVMDRHRAPPGAPRAPAGDRRAGAEPAPATSARERGVRAHRRAVGGRRRGARRAPGDPHRRARHRQDGDDACARRPRARQCAQRAPVRADRQGGAAADRGDRRARDDDPPPARVVPGEGFARGPERPDRRHRRARRRRGLDALAARSPTRCSARSARGRMCCWSATPTSSPRSAPGRVLEDLIESGVVPTVRLHEIFRQAARSLIVRAAHAINAGEPPVRGRSGRRARLLRRRARRRRRRCSRRS